MSEIDKMKSWVNDSVLTGQVAVVTGGGSGIGRAISLALAAAGAKVVVGSRRKEVLLEVVNEIKASGGEAMAVTVDVCKQEDIDNLMNETVKAYGTINILVNNSGISIPRIDTLDITKEDWHKIMDINLEAAFFVAQGAARVMSKTGGGRIVNLSSLRGTNCAANIVPYCTSKGGINALTRALAVDLAPYNINVNAIAPGYIPTDIIAGIMADQEKVQGIMDRTPLKKMGTVEEMAAAVLYLCVPQSSYTTGHVLVMDGGWSCL